MWKIRQHVKISHVEKSCIEKSHIEKSGMEKYRKLVWFGVLFVVFFSFWFNLDRFIIVKIVRFTFI